jgi:hypothetical protein
LVLLVMVLPLVLVLLVMVLPLVLVLLLRPVSPPSPLS